MPTCHNLDKVIATGFRAEMERVWVEIPWETYVITGKGRSKGSTVADLRPRRNVPVLAGAGTGMFLFRLQNAKDLLVVPYTTSAFLPVALWI